MLHETSENRIVEQRRIPAHPTPFLSASDCIDALRFPWREEIMGEI